MKLILLFTTILLLNTVSISQSDLQIFPKRAIFEKGQRSAIFNLANIGKDTARYIVSFSEYEMGEDGSFTLYEKNDSLDKKYASDYLRVFPRSVVLPPNGSQTVKVQVRGASGLAEGEYRSHLYMRSVSFKQKADMGIDSVPENEGNFDIKLVPVYGFSVPIIIRAGKVSSKPTFSNIEIKALNDSTDEVSFDLNREGNGSVYGNLMLEHKTPIGGKTLINQIKGVSVYTEINKRRCGIKINHTEKTSYDKGSLRLTLVSNPETNPLTELTSIEFPLKQ